MTHMQTEIVGHLPATASEVARRVRWSVHNVRTVLVRLEKAGIVRSYYVKATRVFVLAEKRFKRRYE